MAVRYKNIGEMAKNVFLSIPDTFNGWDATQWTAAGGAIGALSLLIAARKKKGWGKKVLWGSAVGAALGLGGYTLRQNIRENLGYYYTGKAKYEDMFPKVDKSDPNRPGKDYMIYIPGSIMGKRTAGDIRKTDTSAVIPAGHTDQIKRFAEELLPQDRLHIVGFSNGGGAAMDIAHQIKRPISTVVAADPVGTPVQAIQYKISPYWKPANVDRMKIFAANDYKADTPSNKICGPFLNMFAVGKRTVPGYTEIVHGDHSMTSTGYRVNEEDADSLEALRQRILQNRESFPSAGK